MAAEEEPSAPPGEAAHAPAASGESTRTLLRASTRTLLGVDVSDQLTGHLEHADEFAALCKLKRVDYHSVGELAKAGGIERVVISALDEHRDDSPTVIMSLKALYTIASDERGQATTFASGGVEAVVAAMEELPADAKVQEWACAVLWRLAWDNGAQAVKIAAAGGILRVTEAMAAHAASEGVQENGCWALINLALNDANVSNIHVAGGIELAMQALMAFEASFGVQEAGCGLLLVLSKQPSLVNQIRSAGGVSRVKHALAMSGVYENTKRWCDELLDNLGDPDRKNELVCSLKAAIKHAVSACCSTEFQMYRRRQQGTDAVKNHILKVSVRTQSKLIAKIAKLQPGEDIDDPLLDPLLVMQNVRAGLPEITDELAFTTVVQTSKELSPAFRWLSAFEPSARQLKREASKLAASAACTQPERLTIDFPRTLATRLRQRSALRDVVMRELDRAPPSSCEALPVRYSPYVGLVFENPAAGAESIGAASEKGNGDARVGAVVNSVVEKGIVAWQIGDTPGEELGEQSGQVTDFVTPGDLLVAVDDHRVDESTSLSQIIQLLAGEPGTPVKLKFHRDQTDGGGSMRIAQHCVTILRAETEHWYPEGAVGKANTSAQRKGKMSCEGCRVLVVREMEAGPDQCTYGRFLDQEVMCDSSGEFFTVDFYICCDCRDGRELRELQEARKRSPYLVQAQVPHHKGEGVCAYCKIRSQEREARERRQEEAKHQAEIHKLELKQEEKRKQVEEHASRAKEQAIIEARDRHAEQIRQKEVQRQTEIQEALSAETFRTTIESISKRIDFEGVMKNIAHMQALIKGMRDSLSHADVHAQGCEAMRCLIEEIELRGDFVEGLKGLEKMRSRLWTVQTAVDRLVAARKKHGDAQTALAAAQAALGALPARIEAAAAAKQKLLDEADLPLDAKTRRAVDAATQVLTDLAEELEQWSIKKDDAVALVEKTGEHADAGLNDLKAKVIAGTDNLAKDLDELSKAFFSDVRTERTLIDRKAQGISSPLGSPI